MRCPTSGTGTDNDKHIGELPWARIAATISNSKKIVTIQPSNQKAMITGMRAFFAKRRQRHLIEMATKALYSEQFDLDPLLVRMSRNRAGVPLLRAYVAVQAAARLKEPLADADVDRACHVVQLSEAHAHSPAFTEILGVHRELAEHYWSLQHLTILQGKLAYKNDRYSYEGAIYILQNSKKGPISREQRAEYESKGKQLSELSRQIEDGELRAWKKQDEAEYHRYKQELEARALSAEIDANEDQALRSESIEIASMLEAKLNMLLSSGDVKT